MLTGGLIADSPSGMHLFDVSTVRARGAELPKSVLYSISARLGGSGLDTDAFETVRGIYEAGILGRAIVYGNCQRRVPASRVKSLRWHPVRLLSGLERSYYYGAKKHYLDAMARSEMRTVRYDAFHGWSGECVRTLREARRMGIPSPFRCVVGPGSAVSDMIGQGRSAIHLEGSG